jgi:hypothetical protein
VVSSVGGSSAANVHSAELLANGATSANTANAIVRRDGSGNFAAGTITASLNGAASGFSGSLAGNVTGTQGATVVSSVGGSSAANVHSAELLANGATSGNTANAIVRRDAAGDMAARRVSAEGGFLQPGAGGEALKIIRGIVQGSNGAILDGAGYSVVRNSAGNYTITFLTGFVDTPSVVVTSGSPFLVSQCTLQTSALANCWFATTPGLAASDPAYFNFIAIGRAF